MILELLSIFNTVPVLFIAYPPNPVIFEFSTFNVFVVFITSEDVVSFIVISFTFNTPLFVIVTDGDNIPFSAFPSFIVNIPLFVIVYPVDISYPSISISTFFPVDTVSV